MVNYFSLVGLIYFSLIVKVRLDHTHIPQDLFVPKHKQIKQFILVVKLLEYLMNIAKQRMKYTS